MTRRTIDQHIEITPGIAGGKPRISGHRITVQDIVVLHEKLGRSPDDIAADYELSLADVHAALAYYFDNRDDIDQSIGRGDELVRHLRSTHVSKLPGKLNGGHG